MKQMVKKKVTPFFLKKEICITSCDFSKLRCLLNNASSLHGLITQIINVVPFLKKENRDLNFFLIFNHLFPGVSNRNLPRFIKIDSLKPKGNIENIQLLKGLVGTVLFLDESNEF